MRWPIALWMSGLLAFVTPATAPAQAQECELLPGAREATRVFTGSTDLIHISGPATFICPGDVRLEADSAVGNPATGEIELIGRVFYQDSIKTLNAGWARYLRVEARLFARDEVELTDRKSLSVITGEELEYLPANEERAESEAIVQGRPHAVFQQRVDPDAPPPDTVPEPLEIDADLMRIYGEDRFVALGSVVLTRSDIKGYAHEGEFDQSGQLITLSGSARLEGESFKLSGERIEATLDDQRLREVIARQNAVLEGEDMDLRAPDIHVLFEEGEIHRLVALKGSGAGDTAEEEPTTSSTRPIVVSRELQLTADSIDALLPGRELKEVVAVGNAYAVRAVDSLDIGLPDAIANDWLVGDTITSYFVPAPKSEPIPARDEIGVDKASGKDASERVVLDRLVAVGADGRARALYRIREKGRETESPGVNYLIADRIVLVMSEGEVKNVEADGPIEGMHLQPATVKSDAATPPDADPVAPPSGSHDRSPN